MDFFYLHIAIWHLLYDYKIRIIILLFIVL